MATFTRTLSLGVRQTAIYCGVPDANTDLRIARQILSEDPAEEAPDP